MYSKKFKLNMYIMNHVRNNEIMVIIDGCFILYLFHYHNFDIYQQNTHFTTVIIQIFELKDFFRKINFFENLKYFSFFN